MARTSFEAAMRRLCDLSVERAYNPFREFTWPAELPGDVPWMSAELLTPYGTRYMAELTDAQLRQLSRWELVNVFSFNVHGIRELMQQVLGCIHKVEHEAASEYFHHFLDEENKHMWFFAEFCKRYGGKVYVAPRVRFPAFEEPDIQTFLAFAKILISEQISDFYNVHMMTDAALPAIVRQINRVHHEDESRHIAMGLRIVRPLRDAVVARYSAVTCRRVASYLARYMQFFVESFYNPSAYRDAGLAEPYAWRRRLLEAPERKAFHARVLDSSVRFLARQGFELEEVDR